MKIKLYLVIGLTVLLLGPIPGLTQPPGGGGGGGGDWRGGGRNRAGGGGWWGDPNQMFNMMANGKDVLVRAEITDPRMQRRFDQWAQQLNITNGQITREQFVTMMQQRAAGGAPAGAAAAPVGGNQQAGNNPDAWSAWAENMFNRLDQNGDGFLNNDEMPEGLRAERDKWDTDHNGLIDLNEFKAYFQARVQQFQADRASAGTSGWSGEGAPPGALLTPAPPPEEEQKPVVYRAGKLPQGLPSWFQQLDTDGDGQIGLYEWKASGRPIAEFEKMDRNKDGFLTIAEVLRYTEAQAKSAGGASPFADAGSANGGMRFGGFAGGAGRFGNAGNADDSGGGPGRRNGGSGRTFRGGGG